MPLYPMLLEPQYKEKVWGGRSLESLGRTLPGGAEAKIGESWEVADLESTSPSGGGGGAAHSKILNGPLIKRTLDDVLGVFPEQIMGGRPLTDDGRFPLLLKYLDARENLSVQVHPSPSYLVDHPEARLKSEAWYIVDAEPDAVIYMGLREGVSRTDFEEAIRRGGVEGMITAVPAVPGACHYLPSGTCHALGAGVLVAEVCSPSDTTFRVFDWGRTDRDLHVEEALACMHFGPVDASKWEPGTTEREDGVHVRHKVRCAHFGIDEWVMEGGRRRALEAGEVSVVMMIRGDAQVEWGDGGGSALDVRAGQSVLIPAGLSDGAVLATTKATLLRVTLPAAS